MLTAFGPASFFIATIVPPLNPCLVEAFDKVVDEESRNAGRANRGYWLVARTGFQHGGAGVGMSWLLQRFVRQGLGNSAIDVAHPSLPLDDAGVQKDESKRVVEPMRKNEWP